MKECTGLFSLEENKTFLRSAVIISQSTDSDPVILEAFIDISEKKKIEEELEKHQHSLENLIADRTRELDISNKELESYSASIAHDLRGPLRSIVSFSQILTEDAREGLSEENLDLLSRITQASKRMAHVIDSILNVSKITRANLEVKKIDLTNIVGACIENIQNLNPSRSVEWRVAKNIISQGDETLISQMIDNLIGNAFKYTTNTNLATIEFGEINSNDGRVYFVKDNGIGFDMRYADKLFSPFYRLHTNTTYEGSGIGLATVQRIIDRHGGKIWAESKPNEGSVFYFTLPGFN